MHIERTFAAHDEPRPASASADALQSVALATAAVLLLFVVQGRMGFNIGDEGYLWYGTQRVLAGEVPIRDFMAYDPGRYYWSAAFAYMLGDDGIMSVRSAASAFQAIGLAAAIFAIRRYTRLERVQFLLITAVLCLWMLPRHKHYDISLSILLVLAMALLIERPSRARHFAAGMVVGIAAVFGRNHGVYGAAGLALALALVDIRTRPGMRDGFQKAALAGAGLVVGYAPVLAMIALVPGFGGAFWESIRFILGSKTTNLDLPVPWPWLAGTLDGVLTGVFFVLVLACAVLLPTATAVSQIRGRGVPVIVAASAVLAAPYAHYAFSRADVGHLAQGIFPSLIGMIALCAFAGRTAGRLALVLLAAASIKVSIGQQPLWTCRVENACSPVRVGRDQLQADKWNESAVKLVTSLAGRAPPEHPNVLALPYLPGAYPVLGQRAPVWATYALWPRDEAFQRAEIDRIKAADPEFAVVLEGALDGRKDRSFKATNPLILAFIEGNFERTGETTPIADARVYRRIRSTP